MPRRGQNNPCYAAVIDDPTIWYLAPPVDLRQPVAVASFGNSGKTRITITELRSQRPLLSAKHPNNPRQPRLQDQRSWLMPVYTLHSVE